MRTHSDEAYHVRHSAGAVSFLLATGVIATVEVICVTAFPQPLKVDSPCQAAIGNEPPLARSKKIGILSFAVAADRLVQLKQRPYEGRGT